MFLGEWRITYGKGQSVHCVEDHEWPVVILDDKNYSKEGIIYVKTKDLIPGTHWLIHMYGSGKTAMRGLTKILECKIDNKVEYLGPCETCNQPRWNYGL